MIRNMINTVRERFDQDHQEQKSTAPTTGALQVEPLEDRIMLAFVGFFDGITLDLVQTFDDGDVIVDNAGVGGAFRTIDNADTLTFVDAQNVTVTMLDGTANQLNFNIETEHSGDVQLNLGDGPRDIVFGGGLNLVGGNMEVNGGTGPQFVNLAPILGLPFQTGGDATFSLGDGFDTVYNNENFVIIGNDLNLIGVNLFRYTDFAFPPIDADLKVGGNLTMDTTNESTESFLVEGGTFHDPDPAVNERSIIGGDFIYRGGEDIDHVNLNDTYIVGNVDIDLGLGTPFFGDPQNVTTTLTLPLLLGGPTAQIDGNIRIAAGDSNLGNIIDLEGEFFGDTVDFELSDKVDMVIYSLLGGQADITALMGAGDDQFTMNSNVNVMDIDFGNDLGDEFINNIGQFTFDSDITNFHWFDHLYTEGDDTLVLNQLMDVGDIIIDNDGGPGANSIDWRLTTSIGGVGSTTPADNFELNMLDNTGNVEMDLFNPVIAFLTLNLGDGDRNVDFTGSSNNPLRDINITADQGDQHIELSVNAPLAVATLNVNLGSGFDTVDDDANNLLVSEDFILQGVNYFENDGILSVTRHAFISSTSEIGDTVFGSNGTFFVGGLFTYAGGAGRDEVRINGAGGSTFSQTATLNLGDNVTGGTQYVLLDGPNTSFTGTVTVDSIAGTNPDVFATAADTDLGNHLRVNLGDGPNDAMLIGQLGGFTVDYRGGSGVDNVTFGTTGNPAEVDIRLGADDDTLTLLSGASISTLFSDSFFVNFGGGNDTFINLYGPFDFSAILLDLDGFNHAYHHPSQTLTSTQVSDPGPVTVDNNGTLGAIRFLDGGINELTPVSNLEIEMLSFTGTDLSIDLDNALSGDLTVDLASGNRDLDFIGDNNSIGGNLNVMGDADVQNVLVAVNNHLSVSGDARFDLGSDNDTVDESGNNIDIGGHLDFIGVNNFENNGTMTVGGNLSVNNSLETQNSEFDDDMSITIGGHFDYIGGLGRDGILLNGTAGTVINGDANINVGGNTTGGTQSVWFNSALASVGGDLNVVSTDNVNADDFLSDAAASFGGDINVSLGGGQNTAVINGVLGGSNVTYNGGNQGDTISFGTTGNPADVNVILGGGSDTFTLEAGAAIAPTTLRVDFGGGNDTFINNFGAFTFNASLLNWQGYNRFYNHALSRLNITQVADTGDVTIDNNGAGGAIRLLNAFITEITPADNVRLNLLSNTTTDVKVDYDVPQAGYTILDLRSGDRDVRFIGDSNQIGGFLRIEAGTDGVQDVRLAVNADLNVNESVVINLRNGVDKVDEGANDLNVGDNFILRAVNTFVNDQVVNVAGNFTVNNSFDNETSMLQNSGTANVGGNFNYFGGNSADNVFMANANIGGNVNVELKGGNNTQTADFSGATMARLRIVGDSTVGGNHVLTNVTTTVTGDVVVNFAGTSTVNNVTLQGNYGGTYGTYRGGIGRDNVIFGAIGTNMHFVTRLRDSIDTFTLQASTNLSSSLLDFGPGNDVFIDEIGAPYPFPLSIINLP